jgi:hypothetical protein
MKKAILVLLVGLFWCNVGFAEEIFLNCKGITEPDEKTTLVIDLNKKEGRYVPSKATFPIQRITNEIITYYGHHIATVDGKKAAVYWSNINRISGEWTLKTTYISKDSYDFILNHI